MAMTDEQKRRNAERATAMAASTTYVRNGGKKKSTAAKDANLLKLVEALPKAPTRSDSKGLGGWHFSRQHMSEKSAWLRKLFGQDPLPTAKTAGPLQDFAAQRIANAGDPGVGPGGPAPKPQATVPSAPVSADDSFGALLRSQIAAAGSAVGPAPDKASYLRPFDEAQARAQQQFDRSVPLIAGTYSGLRDQLTTGQQAYEAQQAQAAIAAAQRGAQALEQIKALQAPIQQDINAQAGGTLPPSLQGAVAAEGAQQQANLVAQAARFKAMQDNIGATGAQSHSTRLLGTQVAEQNAANYNRTQLDGLLNQIGLRKADAERQYGDDTNSHARTVASAQQSAMDSFMDQQTKATAAQQKLTVLPSEVWQKYKPLLRKSQPKAMAAYEELMAGAGWNRAKALQYLAEGEENLKSGDSPWGVIDPNVLRRWIEMSTDDTGKLPAEGLALLL